MYQLNKFMYHIFQIIYKAYTIELGLYWGIMLGFRTFEADEYHNQKEIQLYVPFIYIALVKKLQDY
tara:strand:- start:2272 stop:2469 length:198 start_codon:yes stop_codon:yes gene_type:complete